MQVETLIFLITAITVIFVFIVNIRIENEGKEKTQNLVNALLKQNDLLKKHDRIQQKRIERLETVLKIENETISMLMEERTKETKEQEEI